MPEPFIMIETRMLHSTIWREDSDTRIVWVTMLLMVNLKDGTVKSSLPGLADAARVSIEAAVAALEKFKAPDKWSGNHDNEGRRIEEIKGGWRLLNFEEIKKAHQQDRKTAYMRGYMQEYRGQQPPSESALNGDGPVMEDCLKWLLDVRNNGADYTEKEMRTAWLSLQAAGWMWGKNPVTDWRSALESRIQTDRQRSEHGNKTNRSGGAKRTNLTDGTRNEGKGHLYRNAAVKGMDDLRRPDAGKDAAGGAAVPLGTPPDGK